jgi:hypothetical protein
MNCIGKTKNGQLCQGHPRSGSEYCFFHDPASVKNRREAQRKGGSNRSRLAVMPPLPFDIDLDDPHKIPKQLTYIANGIVRGQIDPKVAYAFGYLADCAMRAHKAGELTDRIAEIERLQRVEHVAPVRPPVGPMTQFEDEGEPTGS